MALPGEYVIQDVVRSIGDVIVYRADHPIHGIVNVYLPDDTLPPDSAMAARRRLYQSGLQMRNVSLLNVPLATKALEVSQNPNEPYIVTKYAKHDLEEFIDNGVTIKPKRMFAILSQVLQAIVGLAANGCVIDYIHPRQCKLSEQDTGNISFSVIEAGDPQSYMAEITAALVDSEPGDAVKTPTPKGNAEKDNTLTQTVEMKQRIDRTQTSKDTAPTQTVPPDVDRTVTRDENAGVKEAQRQLRTRQRNIHLLGNITYQLLFGRKYLSSEKIAAVNIRKLAGRWRKILEKALSSDIDYRYGKYETILQDIRKALNRNKRVAIASIPFLLLLVVIAGYFAYGRYHRHKIMTSEAGQAIKSFLDIVNKTNDEFPELQKPAPVPSTPDDKTILKPFDKIEPVNED